MSVMPGVAPSPPARGVLRRPLASVGAFELGALIALVVIAIALRGLYLNQPMRYDEAFTYTNTAAKGLRYTISTYHAPNNHIFHTALVRVSAGLFGNEPWALRLPAFTAGALLVPATYVAGRLLYGRVGALLAAALVAALAELVVFSTDARGYTMVSLAFLLLIVLGCRLKRSAGPREWGAFAAVAAFGMWTVPTMLYPLGAVSLWLALSAAANDTAPRRAPFARDLVVALLAAGLLTVMLYAPVLLGPGPRALVGNQYVTPDSTEGFLTGLRTMPRRLWEDWMLGVPGWERPLLAAGFVAGLAFHRRVARDRIPLALVTIVWCLALLCVTRRVPGVRIWLFLLPLAALPTGAGLSLLVAQLPERRRELAAAALSVTIALATAVHAVRTSAVFEPTLGDRATFRDAPLVAAYLRENLVPGDRVLTDLPSDAPLEYYLDRGGVPRSYLAWSSMRHTAQARLAGSERLVAVVNPQTWQSLESVLRTNGAASAALSEASRPRHFPHGAELHFLRWAADAKP